MNRLDVFLRRGGPALGPVLMLSQIGLTVVALCAPRVAEIYGGEALLFIKRDIAYMAVGLACFAVAAALSDRLCSARSALPWAIAGFGLALLAGTGDSAQRLQRAYGIGLGSPTLSAVCCVCSLGSFDFERGSRKMLYAVLALDLLALSIMLVGRQAPLASLAFLALMAILALARARAPLVVAASAFALVVGMTFFPRAWLFLERMRGMALDDPQGGSYQLLRSLEAARSGGFLGLWNDVDPTRLPNSFSDFFFALIPHAAGVLGTAVALALAVLFLRVVLGAASAAAHERNRRMIVGLSVFVGLWFLAGAFTALGWLPPSSVGMSLVRNNHAALPGYFLAGMAAGSASRPDDAPAKSDPAGSAIILAFSVSCVAILFKTICLACA